MVPALVPVPLAHPRFLLRHIPAFFSSFSLQTRFRPSLCMCGPCSGSGSTAYFGCCLLVIPQKTFLDWENMTEMGGGIGDCSIVVL